jgi:hypothetical protein
MILITSLSHTFSSPWRCMKILYHTCIAYENKAVQEMRQEILPRLGRLGNVWRMLTSSFCSKSSDKRREERVSFPYPTRSPSQQHSDNSDTIIAYPVLHRSRQLHTWQLWQHTGLVSRKLSALVLFEKRGGEARTCRELNACISYVL